MPIGVLSSYISFPYPYVNNILKKENQVKTPEKWGKKRLRIFP